MLKEIFKYFKSEGHENIHTPADANEEFMFKYKNLVIGILTVKDGEWVFKYTDEFKNQNELQFIFDFPDVNKEYRSKELWPIFEYRIPGLNQPKVQEIIEKEKIDKENPVDLLKRFGRYSINNPFELASM